MKKTKLSLIAACMLMLSQVAYAQKSDYVVTVKGNSESIDTAGSFTVVSAKEIKKQNASNILTVLQNTVGINVSENDRAQLGRKNISVRGMNPNHTLILIDGQKISETDANIGHSDFQYSWIPMDQIEKIEIIRGPMSSLYGSKALGGVVNIITKKPSSDFKAGLDIKYSNPQAGEGIGRDVSFDVSKKFDKFSFSLGVEKKTLEEVLKQNEKGVKESEFEGLDVSNLNLKLAYDIDDTQTVSFNMLRGKETREATLNISGTSKHYDEYYDIDKQMYNFRYDKTTHFGGFNLNANITDTDAHSPFVSKTHKFKDKTYNAEFYVDALENNYIVFGGEYKKEYYGYICDNALYTPPGAPASLKVPCTSFIGDQDTKSFYVQDEINIYDKFLLTLGGRYDNHEKFGGEFSPKIYGVYKLGEHHRLKAGYGRGFNSPTIKQSSDHYHFSNPNARHDFIGNSNIKPEIVDAYELGYEYHDSLHVMKITGFYNDIKDLIDTKATGKKAPSGYSIDMYSNVKSATTSGAEFELSRKDLFLQNLDVAFFYTYLHTKDKENNRELNNRAKNKVNVNVDYAFNSVMSSRLSYAYTGEQKYYDDVAKTVDVLDGYSTLGLQFNAKATKNLTLRAGIDNLTNEKLADIYSYQLRNRTYYLGFNYQWKW